MQDSLVYSDEQTGGRQQTAKGTRKRIIAVLLTVAVIILAASSVAWLQWAAQRSIELGYPMPTVHISSPASTSLLLGQSHSFSASSSGRDVTCSWDFGDQSPPDFGSTVSHSYQSSGTYTITVHASDPAGHSSIDQLNVTVLPPPPQANFNFTLSYYGSVSFDASASTADASTSISSYNWDFGDGTTDSTSYSQDSHVYSYVGNFQVTLYVVDATGQQSQPVSTTVAIS